jgi:hypothetical protein
MDIWATNPPVEPYFDPRLNASILTRYRDVAAALRDPTLIPSTALNSAPPVAIDVAVHADFRTQALHALSPTAIEEWIAKFRSLADEFVAALPADEPVDLIEQFATPWSLQVAAIAANLPAAALPRIAAQSRAIFDSAGEPFDQALSSASHQATLELSAVFGAAPPWTIQMFVALAHSLPAFLGNAWLALCEQSVQIADYPAAIEELLRFAGPAKAQFRARASGERVILRLDIANRDPEQFPAPDTLRFDGRAAGHVAFGAGPHACVGAALVRSAAAVATKSLLTRFRFAEVPAAVPVNCFAVRYLRSLRVILRKDAEGPALCL